MELQIGKITNKDLAEWMGITANTLNKNKEKYLKELKNFADFHLDGKKVVIDNVINPVFSKQGSEAYQKVRDKVDKVWDNSGLDSCSRVGNEIYEILTEEDKNFALQSSTVYNYTIKGRNELYGKPFMSGGRLGNCVYLWCKKREDGGYSMLTEEEQVIKQQLQTKYFGDATEKQILVKAMVETGELSKEEAWDVLEEMTNMRTGNFLMFLRELELKVGCQVVKGTMVKRLEEASAF